MIWPFENDTSAIIKNMAQKSIAFDKKKNLFCISAIVVAVAMIMMSLLNMREESQMDSEVNCQREWFKSRGSDVPLWNRQNLSIEETAAYTGIGRDTIYKLIKQDDCNFTLRVGKRTMIKRKRFEEYLEKLYSI